VKTVIKVVSRRVKLGPIVCILSSIVENIKHQLSMSNTIMSNVILLMLIARQEVSFYYCRGKGAVQLVVGEKISSIFSRNSKKIN
jgi:hypothetical protein